MQITFENIHGNDTVYMDCLRAICGDTEGKSMVDIGCNLAPHTPKLGFEQRTYIDILDRVLDHTDEQKYFIRRDALKCLPELRNHEIDVMLSLDNIEHFTEYDALHLLKLMKIKSHKMVLFTPLGEYLVDPISIDPEGHHSGWTPEKLESILPNYFAYVVLPQYHPTLGIGAFFFWHCKDIKNDFERVFNELKQKTWATNLLVAAL